MKSSAVKKTFRVLRIIKNSVLGVVLGVLLLVLVFSMIARITGGAPSFFGYSVYRVSSGSMAPELQIGDVIFVTECDGMSVQTDDIVTYIATSGDMEGKLITHRVVRAPYSEDGQYYIITKGDSNARQDNPVNVNEIKGRLIFKSSVMSFIYNIFITPMGLLILIALIIAAFFNEIVILVKSILGIGYEPEPVESVDDIIAKYQNENTRKAVDSDRESEEK